MGHTAEYMIVQHVADLFRRETENVGVVVRLDGQTDAWFFGEIEPGKLDGHKARKFPNPGIYAQWVRHWRRTILTHNGSAWDEILDTTKGNYQILGGGSVDRIGEDSIGDVTRFLFSALVTDGIASALGGGDEEGAVVKLRDAIKKEFKSLGILLEGSPTLLTPKYPVIPDAPVKGQRTSHNISFVQRAVSTVVMEPIDLGVRDKKGMKYHAGWTETVFADIRRHEPKAKTVAIVSATAAEQRTEVAKHALSLMSDATIVNWLSDVERKEFLDETKKTAKG